MSHMVDQAILPCKKHESELIADNHTQIQVEKIRPLRDRVEGVVVGYSLQLC